MESTIRVRAAHFLVFALFSAFILQGVAQMRGTSPTTDEVPFHMVNGYAYLKTHDYRMSPANPALIREWMALPWLALSPKLDLNKKSWKEAESIPFGREVFYEDNRGMADRLLYSSRSMILLLGVALGVLIFVWAKALYGFWGGILSLSLYAFCPNFIAYSSIAHTDLGITLFSTLAAFFLWRYLEGSRAGDFWGFAFACGLACAAKFNALYVCLCLLFVFLAKKGFRAFLKGAALTAAVGFLVIWASYFFEFKPLLNDSVPRLEEKLGYVGQVSHALFPGNEAAARFLKDAAVLTPIPMPSYLLGLAGIVRSHQSEYRHFAFGEWTTRVQWYYYFFSFAVKMTLPFLLLLICRGVYFRRAGPVSRNGNAVLLTPVIALFVLTCFDSTAIGIRYLLPAVSLLMVWVGGLATVAASSRLKLLGLTAIALWHAASALLTLPNDLSYFNPLVGGMAGGYRYVRGSDADWGQGLKALKNYMEKKGVEEVVLEYFGSADPSFYGIKNRRPHAEEEANPGKNVYAVSIFYLEHLAWTRQLKPTALVGGSIFIYDLR